MYEKALVYLISHTPKVARAIASADGIASVGLSAAARVWATGEIPQNADLPLVSFQEVAAHANTRHQQGEGELSADTVVVIVWAEDFNVASEIRRDLRNALKGQSGTFDGETLDAIFIDQRRFDHELPGDRGEHDLQAATLGLTVWHRED